MNTRQVLLFAITMFLLGLLFIGLTHAQQPMIPLGPIKPNTYGPGVHSDGTGRAFTWQPTQRLRSEAHPQATTPHLQVQPYRYGPNVGSDQYGRPVEPRKE